MHVLNQNHVYIDFRIAIARLIYAMKIMYIELFMVSSDSIHAKVFFARTDLT